MGPGRLTLTENACHDLGMPRAPRQPQPDPPAADPVRGPSVTDARSVEALGNFGRAVAVLREMVSQQGNTFLVESINVGSILEPVLRVPGGIRVDQLAATLRRFEESFDSLEQSVRSVVSQTRMFCEENAVDDPRAESRSAFYGELIRSLDTARRQAAGRAWHPLVCRELLEQLSKFEKGDPTFEVEVRVRYRI